MFKLRLIAAAALASVMVPAVAHADKNTDRTKYLVQLKADQKANLARLRSQFDSGKGRLSQEELKARMDKLRTTLAMLAERIEALREAHASS